MLELVVATLIGIILGTFSGLIPGLHINLISVIIVSLAPALNKILKLSPELLFIVIVCMGLTHTFLDFIPSTFLGVPSPDTVFSILPAHEMVNKGEGVRAILLTLLGSFFSFVFCLMAVPLLLFLFPMISKFLKGKVGTFLLFIILFIMYLEHEKGNLRRSLLIFGLAGILGYFVLNLGMKEPLFPLLSGLFGVSMIVSALKNRSTIPNQRRLRKELIFDLLKDKWGKSTLTSSLAGGLTGFLPGIGAAQASIIGSIIAQDNDKENYLIMQGGINTVNFFISLITLYTISKARNGALVAAQKLFRNMNLEFLFICLIALTITAVIATILGIFISSKVCILITKIDYLLLMKLILVFIIFVTIILSGIEGIIVMIVASVIGVIAIKKDVAKHHCMACILVPVMLWTL
jgi:putative membrane protein